MLHVMTTCVYLHETWPCVWEREKKIIFLTDDDFHFDLKASASFANITGFFQPSIMTSNVTNESRIHTIQE